MIVDGRVYTSRSRYVDYGKCEVYGYYQWDISGRGIVPRSKSIPLSTGIFVHYGLDLLGRKVIENGNKMVEDRVIVECANKAVEAYVRELEEGEFRLKEGEIEESDKAILDEQCSLTKALVLAFGLVGLPKVLEEYEIVDVEKELVAEVENDIHLMGRIDWVIRHRVSRDYEIVNFKTASQVDRRLWLKERSSIQGLSESYLLEHSLSNEEVYWEDILGRVNDLIELYRENDNAEMVDKVIKIGKFAEKRLENKVIISGVKTIHLVKGRRVESSKGNGIYIQSSPLVYGYRNIGGSEVRYAHSYYYNVRNKGNAQKRLGVGWEKFAVWERKDKKDPIYSWVKNLALDKIQTEATNPLYDGRAIVIEDTVERDKWDIEKWKVEFVSRERKIKEGLYQIETRGKKVEEIFSRCDTSQCYYPSTCIYESICWGGKTFDRENWMWRKPHHKKERDLVQLVWGDKGKG